jgi:hypothetical protein
MVKTGELPKFDSDSVVENEIKEEEVNKKYYLCSNEFGLILYCIEDKSIQEETLFKLLNKGWCTDNRQFGNWYKVELFNTTENDINSYKFIKDINNIKTMTFIGKVGNNGNRFDGDVFNIVPLYFFESITVD